MSEESSAAREGARPGERGGEARGVDERTYGTCVALLRRELVCALGCTEPIALAYAAALASAALGEPVERATARCSGNIIKNVKSVAVPNAEGMRGVRAAVTLGIVGGDPRAKLEVLQSVTHRDVERTRELVESGFCDVELVEGVPNLYVKVEVAGGAHRASVTLVDRHTNVTQVTRDGVELSADEVDHLCPGALGAGDCHQSGGAPEPDPDEGAQVDMDLLTVASICRFARTVDLDDVRDVLERQIACNSAISREGLENHWGSEIGRTILATRPIDVTNRMRARAAAGSDARMGGCSLPVVINSGSGNQGITVSMPVIEYAETIHAPHDDLLRALCLSNLAALHLKRYIGSLSAFCGVVCAAAGAGAAVTFLSGGTDDQVGSTIVNTMANVAGIMCDGAKASCAAKIASAVDAAMLGHQMAMLSEDFCAGDGLVADDVETTIMSMGYVGRVGMRDTDVEILNIMIGKTCPEDMRC
jgi:L-cysteine desulfidase